MSVFKSELEKLREQWEIEERLSPSERLKKQVKNFGVELEWASQYDSTDETVVDTIRSLVEDEFDGEYEVTTGDNDGGIQRSFMLTDDNSAKLDTYSTGVEFIDKIAGELASEFENLNDRALEEAEEEIDEADYETEEEYEEARDELYDEKRSEEENRFYEYLSSYITSQSGSDVAHDVLQKISPEDLNDYDANEIYDVLEPFARLLGGSDDEEMGYDYGVELVSPRLAFEEGNIKRIARLFSAIDDSGIARFHNEAGMHVHIGRLDDMHIIHFLRMVYYMYKNSDEVESLAGREFNKWAVDNSDIVDRLEELVSMNLTNDHEVATQYLRILVSNILSERQRAVNLSALSKGTVEFRIGSSEIATNARAVVIWLEFIKSAFDYGVDQDYLEVFNGNRFYMNDAGKWKIATGDGRVQMASKGANVDIGAMKPKSKVEKIWKKFVMGFNDREKLKKKLATDIMVKIENDKDLYKWFYGDDGEINMNTTSGRLYAKYLETGDLRTLNDLFRYTGGLLGPKDVLDIIKRGYA